MALRLPLMLPLWLCTCTLKSILYQQSIGSALEFGIALQLMPVKIVSGF